MENPMVISVSSSPTHTFSKLPKVSIKLLEGLGVEGDAHLGKTVKHRSRVAQDPTQPNLRQVHLIHAELFDELSEKGFNVTNAQMGENITTNGINLLELPRNTILHIGDSAMIQITGLRNPCLQLEGIEEGLMQALVFKDANGELVRKAGIMGIVLESGIVKIGDKITVKLPNYPYEKLERV
jgi:MOSC domain-containing protein YiiM